MRPSSGKLVMYKDLNILSWNIIRSLIIAIRGISSITHSPHIATPFFRALDLVWYVVNLNFRRFRQFKHFRIRAFPKWSEQSKFRRLTIFLSQAEEMQLFAISKIVYENHVLMNELKLKFSSHIHANCWHNPIFIFLNLADSANWKSWIARDVTNLSRIHSKWVISKCDREKVSLQLVICIRNTMTIQFRSTTHAHTKSKIHFSSQATAILNPLESHSAAVERIVFVTHEFHLKYLIYFHCDILYDFKCI